MPESDRHHAPADQPARTRAAQTQWLLFALVLVAVDQGTKYWVRTALTWGERVSISSFFDLTLLYNKGAAFSFLADEAGSQRWLLTGIAAAAIVLLIFWLYRYPQDKWLSLALSCILGGAAGNAIDRLHAGQVTDFFLFYWNNWYFPAFNMADIAITCGAALLILDEILRMQRARRHSRR